jgi:prephenate dehydrogenase
MTRIASSPYGVWGDIIGTNRDLLRDGIERFLAHTREVCGDLDEASLKGHFDRAASTRAEIPRDSKGFLSRLWDVLVVVEDRPGVIAGIAAPLAEKRINIKDIEVLKVREGEGGQPAPRLRQPRDRPRRRSRRSNHRYARHRPAASGGARRKRQGHGERGLSV